MKKIILVLGGIRSGKSTFAENKALTYSDNAIYIATAIPFDSEMKDRIQIHQDRRKNRFRLVEESENICPAIKALKNETVLVDCLTLNLSNRLMKRMERENPPTLKELWNEDEPYLKEILRLAGENDLKLILVSNEAGEAPVAANKLGRYFQELQGHWNTLAASLADEVFLLQAGIPRLLKKQSCRPFKISAPSWVRPGNYLENIAFISEHVDDIQLLLFNSREDDPLFQNDTLQTLSHWAGASQISFSAHMPQQPVISAEPEAALKRSLSILTRIKDLPLSTCTFHFDLPAATHWAQFQNDDIKKTNLENTYISFFQLLKNQFPQINLSLENTITPLSALDRIIQETGISRCVDIGHLQAQGHPLSEIESRLPQASVIHLHGVTTRDGKTADHRQLQFNPEIFRLLETFAGLVTIENYHWPTLQKSLALLADYF